MRIDGPKFIGNALCLDFVNTLTWRGTRWPHDYLRSYGDLVDWSRRGGLLDEAEAGELHKRAAKDRRRGDVVLGAARELREAIHGLTASVARGKGHASGDMAVLNRVLAKAPRRRGLAKGEAGFVWKLSERPRTLDVMLFPIAESAGETLIAAESARLKSCASPECGWVFLDTTRGNRRRWCDMADCGNRVKARRHYLKAHALPEKRR
ncbi:MAG: CGNR zinc finger domain-containing protein [Alphaproteobacteria bacterium]|nr:CGNR zinc finger domain-containing protein [Alphaproteobacteria bacterium]